jgi:hypothetical protein
LHYVTCAKNTKDAWNNICAKFERWHGNKTLQYQNRGSQFSISSHWNISHGYWLVENIDNQISDEDLAFALLKSLPFFSILEWLVLIFILMNYTWNN